MKNYYILHFSPLSLASWHSLLRKSGLLGVACILTAVSGKFFDLRTSSTVVSGAISGSMPFRAACLGVALFIIIGSLGRLRVPNHKGTISFIIYIAISLLSFSWSFVPLASIGKSVELFTGLAVLLVAYSKPNGNEVLKILFNIILYLIFIQLLIAFLGFILHATGFYGKASGGLANIFAWRMSSPFMSANSIGYNSALLLIVLINGWKHFNTRYLEKLFYGVFLSGTLLLSTSRSSIGFLLLALLIVLFFKNKHLFILLAVPFAVVVGLDFSSYVVKVFKTIQGGQAAHVTMSLSGRTVLWQAAFELGKDHPLLGLGFGVGSRAMFYLSQLKGFGDTISTAHNGFLEVFTGTGLLGFLPWICGMSSGLWKCVVNYRGSGEQSAIFYGLWPVFLGTTIMSVGLGGALSEIILLFMIILLLPIEAEKEKPKYIRITW